MHHKAIAPLQWVTNNNTIFDTTGAISHTSPLTNSSNVVSNAILEAGMTNTLYNGIVASFNFDALLLIFIAVFLVHLYVLVSNSSQIYEFLWSTPSIQSSSTDFLSTSTSQSNNISTSHTQNPSNPPSESTLTSFTPSPNQDPEPNYYAVKRIDHKHTFEYIAWADLYNNFSFQSNTILPLHFFNTLSRGATTIETFLSQPYDIAYRWVNDPMSIDYKVPHVKYEITTATSFQTFLDSPTPTTPFQTFLDSPGSFGQQDKDTVDATTHSTDHSTKGSVSVRVSPNNNNNNNNSAQSKHLTDDDNDDDDDDDENFYNESTHLNPSSSSSISSPIIDTNSSSPSSYGWGTIFSSSPPSRSTPSTPTADSDEYTYIGTERPFHFDNEGIVIYVTVASITLLLLFFFRAFFMGLVILVFLYYSTFSMHQILFLSAVEILTTPIMLEPTIEGLMTLASSATLTPTPNIAPTPTSNHHTPTNPTPHHHHHHHQDPQLSEQYHQIITAYQYYDGFERPSFLAQIKRFFARMTISLIILLRKCYTSYLVLSRTQFYRNTSSALPAGTTTFQFISKSLTLSEMTKGRILELFFSARKILSTSFFGRHIYLLQFFTIPKEPDFSVTDGFSGVAIRGREDGIARHTDKRTNPRQSHHQVTNTTSTTLNTISNINFNSTLGGDGVDGEGLLGSDEVVPSPTASAHSNYSTFSYQHTSQPIHANTDDHPSQQPNESHLFPLHSSYRVNILSLLCIIASILISLLWATLLFTSLLSHLNNNLHTYRIDYTITSAPSTTYHLTSHLLTTPFTSPRHNYLFAILQIIMTGSIVINTARSMMKLPTFKAALYFFAALMCYDIFWVYLSPLFFGTSVMSDVAIGPAAPDPSNIIGLGDKLIKLSRIEEGGINVSQELLDYASATSKKATAIPSYLLHIINSSISPHSTATIEWFSDQKGIYKRSGDGEGPVGLLSLMGIISDSLSIPFLLHFPKVKLTQFFAFVVDMILTVAIRPLLDIAIIPLGARGARLRYLLLQKWYKGLPETSTQHESVLGLGDIVIPALFLGYIYLKELKRQRLARDDAEYDPSSEGPSPTTTITSPNIPTYPFTHHLYHHYPPREMCGDLTNYPVFTPSTAPGALMNVPDTNTHNANLSNNIHNNSTNNPNTVDSHTPSHSYNTYLAAKLYYHNCTCQYKTAIFSLFAVLFPSVGCVQSYCGLHDSTHAPHHPQASPISTTQQNSQSLSRQRRYRGHEQHYCWSYYSIGLIGYVMALLLCEMVAHITHSGQPALFFIAPIVIGSILYTAKQRGELSWFLDE